MAATAPNPLHPPNFTYVKILAESSALTSIPSTYTLAADPIQLLPFDLQDHNPVIDFSLRTSADPDHRSRSIQDLGGASQDWGFFLVINDGLPENLMAEIVEACRGFFDFTEEEKWEFQGAEFLSSIRCSTSLNAKVEQILL